MKTRKLARTAAVAAIHLNARAQMDQIESALTACVDLFGRLEAISPEKRVSEATIRKILRIAADHVLGQAIG